MVLGGFCVIVMFMAWLSYMAYQKAAAASGMRSFILVWSLLNRVFGLQKLYLQELNMKHPLVPCAGYVTAKTATAHGGITTE